jgi:hypothetical protein
MPSRKEKKTFWVKSGEKVSLTFLTAEGRWIILIAAMI